MAVTIFRQLRITHAQFEKLARTALRKGTTPMERREALLEFFPASFHGKVITLHREETAIPAEVVLLKQPQLEDLLVPNGPEESS